MKFKHNKRRNTAFLYEALVKELTRATIKNDAKKKKIIVQTLREFFNKNSVLGRELEIYRTLNETFSLKEKEAERLLSEIKKIYKDTINPKNVYSEQSKLIARINKNISPNTFSNFVPNYKNLASIFQIFNDSAPVKSRIIMEGQIIRKMTLKKVQEKRENMQVSNTTLKIFTKKFNNSYVELLQEQKELLSKYISSFNDNGLELKMFLNEEIYRLKDEIANLLESEEIKKDTEMTDKTKSVLKVIEGFKGEHITEKLLLKVLKMQQLVGEIQTNA
tara:strand:- start:1811 stop:2638 length:828 start_codon:yes stop_codon:yes gene_type:complete